MKILWLNGRPETNPGGTEQHTIDFVKAISKERDIELFLAVARDSFVDRNTEGVKKFYVRFRSEFSPLSTLKLVKEAIRIKPDILIANNGNEYLNAFLSAKVSGAELVLFRHMVAKQPLLLKKLVFPRAYRILAVSDYVKEFLVRKEGVYEEKVEVVYNFIDPEEFEFSEERRREARERLGIAKEDVVLLYCGKVERGKGIYEFLEVFEAVKERYSNVKALVVGGGSELEETKARLGEKVVRGPQKRVADFFMASDIFLMPTHAEESFARTVVEAFASKTAVVATSKGNIPYLVENGVNGFLVKPGDVKSMLDKTIKLIENRELRASFQERAHGLYMSKFHRDVVLEKFINAIYNDRL